MGKPRPLLYASPHRPTCAPIEVGKAVTPRDRALFLQLHLAGHSFKAISKMPHIGRHRKTIARIVNRALVPGGSLQPRPRGGAGNSQPILGPPELRYLRVRRAAQGLLGADTGAPAQALLRAFPTLYEDEIADRLLVDCGVKIGKTTVGNNLRKRLGWSRKRLTHISKDKFTPGNAARYHFYTRTLMPVLNKDACVWLDEVGLDVYEAERTHGRCARCHAPP